MTNREKYYHQCVAEMFKGSRLDVKPWEKLANQMLEERYLTGEITEAEMKKGKIQLWGIAAKASGEDIQTHCDLARAILGSHRRKDLPWTRDAKSEKKLLKAAEYSIAYLTHGYRGQEAFTR